VEIGVQGYDRATILLRKGKNFAILGRRQANLADVNRFYSNFAEVFDCGPW